MKINVITDTVAVKPITIGDNKLLNKYFVTPLLGLPYEKLSR